jgi:hypothetical protein
MGSGTSLPSSSEIRRPEDYGRSTSQEAVGWPRLHSIAHQHAMCLSTRVAPVRRIEAAPQKGCRCLCSPSFREVAFFLGVPEITLQGKRGGSKAVSGTATVRRGRCKPVYPNFRAAKVAARDVLQVADDLHLGVPRIPRRRRSSAKADWSRSGEGPEPKLRGGPRVGDRPRSCIAPRPRPVRLTRVREHQAVSPDRHEPHWAGGISQECPQPLRHVSIISLFRPEAGQGSAPFQRPYAAGYHNAWSSSYHPTRECFRPLNARKASVVGSRYTLG